MAKGDTVSARLAAAGNYQPAAGVEWVVTTLAAGNSVDGTLWQLWDGSNPHELPAGVQTKLNLFVKNDMYFRQYAAVASAFTGVQVK